MKTLTPVIYSKNIKDSIDFYKKLGFELINQMGEIEWCILAWNDVKLMISNPNDHIPFSSPIFTGSFYFEIANIDQLWNHVKDWVKIEYPIEDFHYGMREFAIWDPNGYLLQFGENIQTNQENPRIVGIGGVFFKGKDIKKLYSWYRDVLEMSIDDYGTVFQTKKVSDNSASSYLQWSIMSENSTQFLPSKKESMINYRVVNLKGYLEILKNKGVQILDDLESFEYGHFVHILDPEGNKIQLWEPIENEFEKIVGSRIHD